MSTIISADVLVVCRSLCGRRKASLTMHPYPSEQKQQWQKVPGSCLQRFLFILMLLCLAAISVILLAIGRLWYSGNGLAQHPTPLIVRTLSPTRSPSPTLALTPSSTV